MWSTANLNSASFYILTILFLHINSSCYFCKAVWALFSVIWQRSQNIWPRPWPLVTLSVAGVFKATPLILAIKVQRSCSHVLFEGSPQTDMQRRSLSALPWQRKAGLCDVPPCAQTFQGHGHRRHLVANSPSLLRHHRLQKWRQAVGSTYTLQGNWCVVTVLLEPASKLWNYLG